MIRKIMLFNRGLQPLALFLLFTVLLLAAPPRLITYQGKLTNASRVALNGSQDITFRLYNVETGGTAIWAEAHTGANAVTVTKGLFDVELGTISPLNIAFDDTYWMELQVGTETLSPRLRMVAVAYAFRAIVADTALVVGSGAVQTDTTINGDGTAGSPLGTVIGNTIESGEITDGTIVNGDISASAAIDWSKINHPTLDNYQYWTATDGANNTDVNSTGSLTFTGTGGVSVTVSSGAVAIDASSAGDGNNYTTGISFSGATTKTLILTRSGMSDLTASFTDDNTTYSAGDGLDIVGTTFSVDVFDIIGTGLSEDVSNNLVVQYGTSAGTAVQGNQTATITAGSGLTGGISADALGDGFSTTINIGDGTGYTPNADNFTINLGSGLAFSGDQIVATDASTSNECNTSVGWNNTTNSLSVTDACGTQSTTITGFADGTGTSNYITKWTGTNTVGNS